jgi:hypothetical protein
VGCLASSTLLVQPDVAASDYHLFSPLKDAICGNKFEDDEEVISEVKRWLRQRLQCFAAKAYRLSHLGGVRP